MVAISQAGAYYARKRNRNTALVDDKAGFAWGTIIFSGQPANLSTITLGGTVVTFGTNVRIGADLAHTLANLLTFLRASANANILKATYTIEANGLDIRARANGVATFTLVAGAGSNGVVSHATLILPKILQRRALS